MSKKKTKGVERVGNGLRATIRISGQLYRSPVFPIDTPLSKLEKWRSKTQMRFARRRSALTSFADDVVAYLFIDRVANMPSIDTQRHLLKCWVEALGSIGRDDITHDMVEKQLWLWKKKPLSEGTVNKRRTALMSFFGEMNERGEMNPVADTTHFEEKLPPPKHIDYAVIRAVFSVMPKSVAKARLMLLAFAGIPPAQQNDIKPDYVNWKASSVQMPPRNKGKGTDWRQRPLLREGVMAFRYVRRLNAWGFVDSMNLQDPWRRALARARGKFPELSVPSYSPYSLRHSFATLAYEITGDLQKTADLCGHASTETTKRYVQGAVPKVQRQAADEVSFSMRERMRAWRHAARK